MDINKIYAQEKEELKMMNNELLKKTCILEAKVNNYDVAKMYEQKHYKSLYNTESEIDLNTARSTDQEYFNRNTSSTDQEYFDINGNLGDNPIKNLQLNSFMERDDSINKNFKNESRSLTPIIIDDVSPNNVISIPVSERCE